MENAAAFNLNGYANLSRDGFNMNWSSDYGQSLKNIVCDAGEIEIHINQKATKPEPIRKKKKGMGGTKIENNDVKEEEPLKPFENSYHKTFNYDKEYTVKKICGLIFETFYQYVDELGDGDDDHVGHYSLVKFYYKDRKVYPVCDS